MVHLGTHQVIVQAVQQQPEELLGVMLASITEVGTHGELSNAVKEVSWVHSILVALGIHLQPCQPSHTSPTANPCRTTHMQNAEHVADSMPEPG